MPEDHTLTRSFYLLQDFPGRWTGSTVWVDQADPSVNDGVSSVIIGGNELGRRLGGRRSGHGDLIRWCRAASGSASWPGGSASTW